MIDNHFGHIDLDRRTIVISDIHGSLTLLQKLLAKLNYNSNQDLLIINGDIIEKGKEILDTLHYIMELAKHPNVYVLNGNCEWAIYNITYKKEYAPYYWEYLNKQPHSIFWEIVKQNHIDISNYTGKMLQELFQKLLAKELAFIKHNYLALESERYLFVHAGIENRIDYRNSSLSALLEQQFFGNREHPLKQYVVVGHLPTSNYHTTHIDNRIVINDQKKIICIDGGVGVKKIAQLNALVIQDYHLDCVEVHQDYPIGYLIEDYKVGTYHHHKICWPHYEVEKIEKQGEFTLCKKCFNQEELMIKNEYLYEKDGHYYCMDDYEDYQMSIPKGEIIEILETHSKYYYALYNQEVIWIERKYVAIQLGKVLQ